MKYNKAEREEARGILMRTLKPGDKLYTILRHVSRSGMSRDISVVFFDEKEKRHILDWSISRVLDYPLAKHEGVKVGGCGMDMGFHLVYSLSRELFLDYPCLGESCKAAEHVNEHTPRDGKTVHHDGYCLSHWWL